MNIIYDKVFYKFRSFLYLFIYVCLSYLFFSTGEIDDKKAIFLTVHDIGANSSSMKDIMSLDCSKLTLLIVK